MKTRDVAPEVLESTLEGARMETPKTFCEEALAEESRLLKQPLIRAANFHNTPKFREKEFIEQLQQWSRHFSSVNESDLDAYLTTGRWHKAKPGLIVALYNGYRNGLDVMLPLLERYGYIGWFFVPTSFASEPANQQATFVASRTLKIIPNEYRDGRYALNWDELRVIDRNHVVASHTRNHSELALNNSTYVENETVGPQLDFEARLGHRVRSFASLSGAAYGDNELADRLIDKAGYQFIFSNYKIQRIRNVPGHALPPNGHSQ